MDSNKGAAIMKNPFSPNGVTSSKIIYRLAKEEFGDSIKMSDSYGSIKHDIIRALKRMKPNEREENRLQTLVDIEHLKQNDFGNFISVRFAYWGLMVAIVVMIIGDVPIYSHFNMSKRCFGNMVAIILTVLLVTMARTIHEQHDQLEYLNFKLICFDEIFENKRK